MSEIPAATTDLWLEHVRLERLGSRKASLVALDRFIQAMRTLPAAARSEWVTEFCSRPADFAVRFPLFRDLIFPVLRDRFAARDGYAAYWLAIFGKAHVITDSQWGQVGRLGEIGLLERAVEWEPRHPLAARKLIAALADAFERAVHEVPSGILGLLSNDGASVEECEELLALLDRFEALAASEGLANAFGERISDWRLLFRAYREYWRGDTGAGSFAAYLEGAKSATGPGSDSPHSG